MTGLPPETRVEDVVSAAQDAGAKVTLPLRDRGGKKGPDAPCQGFAIVDFSDADKAGAAVATGCLPGKVRGAVASARWDTGNPNAAAHEKGERRKAAREAARRKRDWEDGFEGERIEWNEQGAGEGGGGTGMRVKVKREPGLEVREEELKGLEESEGREEADEDYELDQRMKALAKTNPAFAEIRAHLLEMGLGWGELRDLSLEELQKELATWPRKTARVEPTGSTTTSSASGRHGFHRFVATRLYHHVQRLHRELRPVGVSRGGGEGEEGGGRGGGEGGVGRP